MPKLAGDLLKRMVLAGEPLPPRDRNGGTDPESLLGFHLIDIPFRTEPAVGVVLPPESQQPEGRDAE